MPSSSQEPQAIIEAGAFAAHWAVFGEPQEPLRERGGVLDPAAWCMRFARAIAEDGYTNDVPRLASDRMPSREVASAVEEAMKLAALDEAHEPVSDQSELGPRCVVDGRPATDRSTNGEPLCRECASAWLRTGGGALKPLDWDGYESYEEARDA
jgi:hypothetical protein